MSCGVFDRLAADGVFTGSYSCSSSSGLSAGAKAGIAIGVILIVCIILAAIGLWLRRRRAGAAVNENAEDVEKTQYQILSNTKSILRLPRKPFPPKQPSESVPMLDGRMILEAAPGERRERRLVYELDAGPQSTHQRPIHDE